MYFLKKNVIHKNIIIFLTKYWKCISLLSLKKKKKKKKKKKSDSVWII